MSVSLPRLRRPRCPKCRVALRREESCLRPEETRGNLSLPAVSLVRQVCDSCGYETRDVVADRKPFVAETRFRTRGHLRRIEEAEAARVNVAAMAEWSRAFEDLRAKHRLQPPGGPLGLWWEIR